ncbi:MAG TPA: lysylphosphatidylglycerol synthase domain-containing protein, partial [Roseiflexaceae bacterium]|nr:lysylphosphatidylglycerol synthase domain-containing protein [Roseiflexaceae bacterium]
SVVNHAKPMNDTNEQKSLLSPRKIILQVIFWLAGIGLLASVIWGAVGKGGGAAMWERIREAPIILLLGLLGCTVASAIFNGTTFWITAQPVRRVLWRDMQLINVFANALNYAPVRLGAIARVAYHLRVDRFSLVQVGGWFALIAFVLALGIGSTLVATLLRDRVDWVWLAIVIAQMIVGGAMLRFIASVPFIAKRAQGLDQMAMQHRALWGAIGLRVLDLAAYAGRMGCAMAILGMDLPWSNVMVLAMIALASSLMPVGRVGFREYCVAAAASRLSMDVANIDKSVWDQLALVESAGEAIVFIPLGIAAIPWFRRRWREAKLR